MSGFLDTEPLPVPSPSTGPGGSGFFLSAEPLGAPAAAALPGGQPSPPLSLLAGAFVLVLLGAVCAVLGYSMVLLAVLGWALAGIAAILVYGLFMQRDLRARALAGYGSPAWLPSATLALPLMALVVVAVSSWPIGVWVASR